VIKQAVNRYSAVDNLNLVVAGLLNLDLSEKTFDFAFIAGNGDLHLLQDIQAVETAFQSLREHLRPDGCLALELTLPSKKSWSYPKTVFHSRVPRYTD
jgi:SAM-dependent methyltransferase